MRIIASLIILIAPLMLSGENLLMEDVTKTIETFEIWINSSRSQEELIEAALIEQGIHPKTIRAKIVRFYLAHFLIKFNACPASQKIAPQCHAVVEKLCKKMGISKPIIAISPFLYNAAALRLPGLPSLIIIGTSLMEKTSDEQFEVIVAHELSYIAQNHSIKSIAAGSLLFAGISIPFKVYCRFWMDKKYSNKTLIKKNRAFAAEVLKDSCINAITILAADLSVIFLLAKISRELEYSADKQAAETVGSADFLIEWLASKESRSEVAEKIAYCDTEASNRDNRWYKRVGYHIMSWVLRKALTHPLNEERIAALKAV